MHELIRSATPGAVIETVSVPNGSAGDSHPVLATPRGLHALAPMLPGTGSLPATPGCFAVTVALCTSWPCTGGVRVISPRYSLALPPQHPMPTSLTRLGQWGAMLIAGFGARVGKSSFIWSGFSLPTLPGAGLNRRTGRKSPSLEELSAERRRRESQGPQPAALGGSWRARASPGQPSPAAYLLLAGCFL